MEMLEIKSKIPYIGKELRTEDKKRRRESPKQKRSITANVSLTTLSSMDAALEYDSDLNDTDTGFSNASRNYVNVSMIDNDSYEILPVIRVTMFIICLLGVVGNGIVIWLLGFCVQRNPFMTFILNLGIADLGLLVSATLYLDPFEFLPYFSFLKICAFFFCLMYSASQFLLTAISIDRCVAIFFPFWHRCHRPPRLSTIVCALMWVLSFLLTTITLTNVMVASDIHRNPLWVHLVQFIVNAALCLPLVTISTVALFVKVCLKPRQHRRGKLLTILLLTLSFFLLFAFPFNVTFILIPTSVPIYFLYGTMLLACLNSSVNPVIYFLVGRQRKTRHRETLKMILQRAFREEEGCTEETPVEIQL